MRRRRLVVVGPLPPPVHGVAVSTQLVLANPHVRERFDVWHLDTTDARSIANLGRWDRTNIFLGLRAVCELQIRIGRPGGLLYLPLSENTGGFLRDSLLIWGARLRGCRALVHIRNSLFRDFYSERTRPLRWWIRMTMRRLAGVAVLGESLRSLMAGFVEDSKVAVVPNGTPEFIRPKCEPDRWLVLYLSNLSRKKGADIAVRTAVLVSEVEPSARFVFAGAWEDSSFEQEVRNVASSLDNKIEFVGVATGARKAELMASARVLLFPVAWGEGHPRILLEALAVGLPAVTTDRATIREIVADGESGFVLKNSDPTLLAKRVLRLLHDDALHARFSASAREAYLQQFTQDRADRAFDDWLASLG
jgi:glycosyltransferase involved in cell wall biosynthesis